MRRVTTLPYICTDVRLRWFPCSRWPAVLLGYWVRSRGRLGRRACVAVGQQLPVFPGLHGARGPVCDVLVWVCRRSVVCAPVVGPRARGGLGYGAGFPCFSVLSFSLLWVSGMAGLGRQVGLEMMTRDDTG